MSDNTLQLFFPFPDQTLLYDCTTCQHQPCCHGLGFTINRNGPSAQLLANPRINATCQPLQGDLLFCNTPPSGCHFLQHKQCSLHQTQQRPPSCTLFPFTNIGQINQTIIIAPDPICPITLSEQGITHQSLVETLEKVGIALVPDNLDQPHAHINLHYEMAIRDAASSCLQNNDDILDLCAFDLAIQTGIETFDSQIHASAKEQLLLSIAAWSQLTGYTFNAQPSNNLNSTFLAWYSTMKLFGPALNKNHHPYIYSLLHLYCCELGAYKSEPISGRTIIEAFHSIHPLLWHTPRLLHTPPPDLSITIQQENFSREIKQLQQSIIQQPNLLWWEHLDKCKPDQEQHRLAWLRFISQALQGSWV